MILYFSHRWARVFGQGGVYTLGVSEKNSAAASGGVHRGVNFRKNLEF